MHRLVVPALCAVLMAAPASAQTLPLSGFDAVDASGRLFVEIAQSPQFSVAMEGPHTDRVIARVVGNRLELSTRQNWFAGWSGVDANVRVTLPTVTGIEASAGVDVRAAGISADALSLEASSGADLRVDGTCRTLVADASSGADLSARNLICDAVTASASSGSDAVVHARVSADVDVSSGADLTVEGEGRLGQIDISSGGDLHHR